VGTGGPLRFNEPTGHMMMVAEHAEVAEAVGRRVLGWKGSEFLEFVYLLEEKNTLELLRGFVALSDDEQSQVIEFFRKANGQNNNSKSQSNNSKKGESFEIRIAPKKARLR
jgi:hypothetical protein